MPQQVTDFGRVADDLRRAASSFAALTSSASIFGASLGAFRDFQRQMVLTNAIAQGTTEQLRQMTEAAREFSLVTTTSATEAGTALQQLAQAGFTAQQSLSAMTGVLLLAQATMSDVAVTSDLLSSNIRAFELATTDSIRVSNVFAATVTGSLATMDKLAFAMRQVAPVAQLANLSIEETSAALGTLFNIGLRGEQAGTALRNIIIRLVRPMGEAADTLRRAGVATHTVTGEFRNLADIMTDLANSPLTDADFARIFETEALAGAKAFMKALTTVNSEGVSQYDQLRLAVTGTDRAIELAAKNLSTFDGAMKLLNNTATDFQRAIGEEVAPILVDLSEFIRDIYQQFESLDPSTQQMIIRFVAFGTAAIGLLTALNALVILMRGPLIASFTKLASQVAITEGALAVASGAVTTFLARIGAMAIGLRAPTLALGAFSTAAGSTLVASARAGGVALGRLLASMRSFSLASAALSTGGLALIGGATVLAGIAAAAVAIDSLTTSQRELNEAIDDYEPNDAFATQRASAQDVADHLMGSGTVDEIRGRVEAINNEFKTLSIFSNVDRFGYAGRAQGRLAQEATTSAELFRSFEEEDKAVVEFIRARKATADALKDFDAGGPPVANAIANYLIKSEARDALTERFSALTEEQKARVQAWSDDVIELIDANRDALGSIEEARRIEEASLESFLRDLSAGKEGILPEQYSLIGELIAQRGLLDAEELRKSLAREVAGREGAATLEEVLREVLEQNADTLGLNAQDITDLLSVQQQKDNAALLTAVENLNKDISSDVEEIRIKMLERQMERTHDLTQAMALAVEIGNRQLETELEKAGDAATTAFDETLSRFGLTGRLTSIDILNTFGTRPGEQVPQELIDVLSPASFMEELDAALTEELSAAERDATAERLAIAYKQQADETLTALVEAQQITPSAQAEYLAASAEAANVIADLAAAGVNIVADNPAVADVLSGKALADAINERITSTTPENEARGIIAEETERHKLILEAVINDIVANIPNIDPGVLAELHDAASNSALQINNTAIEGLEDGFSEADKIAQERLKRLRSIAEAGDYLSGIVAAARTSALESQLAIAESEAEAVRLALEIGDARLAEELGKLAERQRDTVDKTIVQGFGFDTAEAFNAALSGLNDELSGKFDNIPDDLLTVLSGEAFAQSINEQIDENTTPAQAQEIVQKQYEFFKEISDTLIPALASAIGANEEEMQQIATLYGNMLEAFRATALAGIDETIEDVQKSRERLQREQERAAKDALRDARALEDAYTSIATSMRDSKRAYLEAVRGLSLEDRQSAAFNLDVEDVIANAQERIRDLNREFEDLSVTFADQPDKLDGLRLKYDELISSIEAERDAQIAAADSFTEQMARRSAALDLFQRDLTDAAIASGNTFDMVNAGVHSAFVDYQKDLVTLVDITSDATTGLIDTLSTGVADLVFDTENALENFGENMLKLSRKVFEGFTTAFVQQLISSATGGEGSILGNALQPSSFGSTGVPGVGDNFLGKLLGGGQQAGPAANPATAIADASTSYVTASRLSVTAMEQLTSAVTSLTASVTGEIAGVAGGPIGGTVTGPVAAITEPVAAASAALSTSFDGLAEGIAVTADALGVSARDLATVISYETGGTFDPQQLGPTTRFGQHQGLIQFGEPQAAQFGVDFSSLESAINTQLGPDGGIVKYLKSSGFEEGMSILDLYSTINAGGPGRYYASDEAAGGAPGNVLEKVTQQFGPHYENADRLLASMDEASTAMDDMTSATGDAANNLLDFSGQLPETALAADQLTAGAGADAVAGGAGADTFLGGVFNPEQTPAAGTAGALAAQPIGPEGLLGGGQAGIQQAALQIQQALTQAGVQLQTSTTQFTTQFTAATTQLVAAMQAAAAQVSASGGSNLLGSAVAAAVPGFAGGGGVNGRGTSTSDDVLAWLSNGEYVNDAKSTKRFRPVLEAMNGGKSDREVMRAMARVLNGVPAFANGGDAGGMASNGWSQGTFATAALSSPNSGEQGNTTYLTTKGGDNITLKVNYNMRGERGAGVDKFRRSSKQHARQLAAHLEKAKRG